MNNWKLELIAGIKTLEDVEIERIKLLNQEKIQTLREKEY